MTHDFGQKNAIFLIWGKKFKIVLYLFQGKMILEIIFHDFLDKNRKLFRL